MNIMKKVALGLALVLAAASAQAAGRCFRCVGKPEGAMCYKGFDEGGYLCTGTCGSYFGSCTCYTQQWCSNNADTECDALPGSCIDHQNAGPEAVFALASPMEAQGGTTDIPQTLPRRLLTAFGMGTQGLIPGYLSGLTDIGPEGVPQLVAFEGRSEVVGGHLVIDIQLKDHPAYSRAVIETWDRGRAGSATMTSKGDLPAVVESW